MYNRPPHRHITLLDFVERAANYGVIERSFDDQDDHMEGPHGPETISWLERETVDGVMRVIKPRAEDGDSLDPIVIESLCRRLNLDPIEFGCELSGSSATDDGQYTSVGVRLNLSKKDDRDV